RQDSFLASYVPVRGTGGRGEGMIVIGVTLADELQRVSEQTTGRALAIVSPEKDALNVVAHTTNATGSLQDDAALSKDLVKRVMDGGKADATIEPGMFIGAAPLDGLGSGKG